MHITTHTGLVGFFLALSVIQVSETAAIPHPTADSYTAADTAQKVENRLARLTAAIRQREALLPEGTTTPAEMLIAGFANARGGGGFINNRGGGGFANVNPWRNAWADGGSFFNNRY